MNTFLTTAMYVVPFIISSSLSAEQFELKSGPNKDMVFQNCLPCHSAKLITQQNLTRKAWDQKITWMQDTQGMWKLSKELRSKILDYLESTQGPKTDDSSKDPMDETLRQKTPNRLIIFRER